MKKLLRAALVLLLGWAAAAPAASLRLEGNRAWLSARDTPLTEVLRLFADRGVDVRIDPAVPNRRISGEWENVKTDRLVAALAEPHSCLLEWERVKSPLGSIYHLSSIRIFAKGNTAAAARPMPAAAKERVLDVVEGSNDVAWVRGEIIVAFREGATLADLSALLAALGGTVIEVIDPPGLYRIRLNEDMSVERAREIAVASSAVAAAEPNYAFKRISDVSVPVLGFRGTVRANLKPGAAPLVAVFDSGLDPQYASLPFIRGTYNALDPDAPMQDPLGHGTLTTLVAAGALTPIGAKAASSAVPVVSVRTFDQNGYTSSDILWRAIDYAADSGAHIITMSWGTPVDSRFMQNLMNYAASRGITLYAAAGNEPTGQPIFPAGYESVKAVGGLTPSGERWERSNYGDFVEEYQPAFVRFNGSLYEGTSIAAPYAAFLDAVQKKTGGNGAEEKDR